jgi:hypothetical protein
MKLIGNLAWGALALVAAPVLAADFDGSKPLVCATVSVADCERGSDCAVDLPEQFGAPTFMRVDFSKKTVTTPRVTTAILLQDKSESQLLLQGREGSLGWTLVLHPDSGHMTVSLTDRSGVYVLFGNCTPL